VADAASATRQSGSPAPKNQLAGSDCVPSIDITVLPAWSPKQNTSFSTVAQPRLQPPAGSLAVRAAEGGAAVVEQAQLDQLVLDLLGGPRWPASGSPPRPASPANSLRARCNTFRAAPSLRGWPCRAPQDAPASSAELTSGCSDFQRSTV